MKILRKEDLKTGQAVLVVHPQLNAISRAQVLIERDFVFFCSNEIALDGGHSGEKLGFRYKWAGGIEINRSVYEITVPVESSQDEISNLVATITEDIARKRREKELQLKREQQKKIKNSDKELIDRVNNYFRARSTSPLVFEYNYDREPKLIDITNKKDMEIVISKLDGTYAKRYSHLRGVNKLVFGALLATRVCISKDKITNKYQTGKRKRRSSGDIWRHVISTNPEVTIFDVMTSLYNLGKWPNNVVGSDYCSDVNKQVFYFGGSSSQSNCYQVDEYGTKFDSWKRAKKLYEESCGS